MMNCPRISVLLVLLLGATCSVARAQISSPALDPHCYQPQLGTPGEFDTVHVNGTQGLLGSQMMNLGPGPGETYGRFVLTGWPTDPPFLQQIETGPNFDLKNVQVKKDLHFRIPDGMRFIRTAHMHTSTSMDLILINDRDVWIYWQGEDGNYYDSLRTGFALFPGAQFPAYSTSVPYITHLVSDTVEDMLMLSDTATDFNDSIFLAFYRGGVHLYNQRPYADKDSILRLDVPGRSAGDFYYESCQGDWRGVGRDDYIGKDRHDVYYYYRNDPPFSLQKWASTMPYDTIFDISENPHYDGLNSFNSMRALPKSFGDSSEDFMPSLNYKPDNTLSGSIYIFKGGPNFGSKRLYMDSADAMIPNPKHLDPVLHDMQWWGSILCDGDMTGTGRPVIESDGSIGGTVGYNFFYVLGDATDSLADIFYINYAGLNGDTITGDADRREDLLLASAPNQTLWLLHGTSKIPVQKHYGGVTSLARAIPRFTAQVEPVTGQIILTIGSDAFETGRVTIRNVLGQSIFCKDIQLNEGIQEISLSMPHLVSGTYILTLDGERIHQLSRLTILQ